MGALIFVIDAVVLVFVVIMINGFKDDYQGALTKLHYTITRALTVNPSIHLEVFIHKVDTLTIDFQQGISKALW